MESIVSKERVEEKRGKQEKRQTFGIEIGKFWPVPEVEYLVVPHSIGAKSGLLLYGSLPLSLNEIAILFVCYVYKVSPLNSYRLDPPRQSGPRFHTSPSIFDVSALRIRVAESLFL